MIYILIGIGLLFISIAFIVTENNAEFLLSGYNTMSKEERKKVDLKTYISYFKKFHIFLGLSIVILGFVVNLINNDAAKLFLAIYPILAYLYFSFKSPKWMKK